jgi:hypothetical protein
MRVLCPRLGPMADAETPRFEAMRRDRSILEVRHAYLDVFMVVSGQPAGADAAHAGVVFRWAEPVPMTVLLVRWCHTVKVWVN